MFEVQRKLLYYGLQSFHCHKDGEKRKYCGLSADEKGTTVRDLNMNIMYSLNAIVGIIFLACYSYQLFYIVVVLVKKKRPHTSEPTPHKFAIMISARNEEKVLPGLLDSINKQDYPRELVTVFVIADNCDDNTADVARAAGAVVYERNNKKEVGKGYALDFLMDKLNHDYPRDAFDAFMVFDADNILSPNYITEINKTYSDGYKVMTSYRNSKNFGDNWITAGYALWFLREAKFLNNARMILGTSCAISGTGFMVDRSILENEEGIKAWKYFLLTEDIQFTASTIVDGEIIGYCGEAELYDEQPITFKQSWNQRLRWAKGYLQVYANYGSKLVAGIFGKIKNKNKNKSEKRKRSGGSCFSCFDMSMTIMPAMILTSTLALVDILVAVVLVVMGRFMDAWILFSMPIINASLLMFVVGFITTVSEWKNIHTAAYKKMLYTFTFPIFMLTYLPIAMVAIFSKNVEWKPIDHSRAVSLDDIHAAGKEINKTDGDSVE